MIVEWLADFFLGIVVGLLDLVLPNADPLGLVVPTGLVRGYAALNGFLPVAEVLLVVGFVVVIYTGLFLYRGVMTVLNLVRGSGA